MQIDYEKLGFKAGLEIHQQLDTGKLFCKCPAFLQSKGPDFIVKRRLHRVAGETGEVDVAAEYESSLGREFIYQGYRDSNCLVELDESPPDMINSDALEEAIKIALLLNCEIYPAVQIMRKTVIDGSNTSGFQRTVLIGHSGFIETSFGKVPVESVALEEDSARIISKDEKISVYRLDRLGIPLVEIGTEPVMKRAEQVKEAALKIGEILRACKVKRGIGTIRQDINMSIKGHERVEIKGFQEPSLMALTINKEIERQQKEIKEGRGKKGEVRNALENGETEFLRPLPGGARMYPETDLPLLRIGREKINEIKKKLPKLRHEIRDELKKKGLSDELINLVLDGHLDEFETLLQVYPIDAPLVAKLVTLWRQETATKLKKSFYEIAKVIDERTLEHLLELVKEGKLEKGQLKGVFSDLMMDILLEDAVKKEKVDDNKLEAEIRDIVKKKPGLTVNAYMGMIIQKLGKEIDKRKTMEILSKIIGK